MVYILFFIVKLSCPSSLMLYRKSRECVVSYAVVMLVFYYLNDTFTKLSVFKSAIKFYVNYDLILRWVLTFPYSTCKHLLIAVERV